MLAAIIRVNALTLTILFISAHSTQLLFATIPEQESVSDESSADSSCADSLIAELSKSSTDPEQPPSFDDFTKLLINSQCKLSRSEYLRVHAYFTSLQKPQLDAGSLKKIRVSIRETIHSLEAEWQVIGDKNPTAGNYHFAMEGAKLFFESKFGKNKDQPNTVHTRAFDGTIETVYNENSLSRQAVRHDLAGVPSYFEWHNPLWISKNIDSTRYLNRVESGLENLDNRYFTPLQQPVEFNGRKCIALLEQEDIYFIDPELNYAYCGLIAGKYDFDSQLGRLVENNSYRVTVLDDFQDCGDSIWLPKKHNDIFYLEDGSTLETIVSTTYLTVNKDVDDSLFTGNVPKDVEMLDGRNGEIGTYGLNNIEKDIAKQIESKSSSWFTKLILGANVIAIVAICIYFLRNRKAGQ